MATGLKVRLARAGELAEILRIYAAARVLMRESGNPHQWGDSYPPQALVAADLNSGVCHVCEGPRGICGVCALVAGDEPEYQEISGRWLDEGPYLTLHRLAGDGSTHGIFRAFADFAKARAASLRTDTHADNRIMQHLLARAGFSACGTIKLVDGTSRLAFQWCSMVPPG